MMTNNNIAIGIRLHCVLVCSPILNNVHVNPFHQKGFPTDFDYTIVYVSNYVNFILFVRFTK